jgi:hypothetical protein
MITPTSVTDFNRDNNQLLEFAIFAVCVAGKDSDQTAKKVEALWTDPSFQTTLTYQWMCPPQSDSQYGFFLEVLVMHLVNHKIGQYERISRILMILNQSRDYLRQISFNALIAIKGIGPKTAAFFILHSRKNAEIPVIDTHICKYMATKGIEMKVSANIPKYMANAELVSENIEMDFPQMSLAEADLYLWTKFSGRVVD